MVNYRLKALIMDVVENQLKMDDPKCTKATLMRLKNLGYSMLPDYYFKKKD